jgi:hypothetical protein
MAAIAAPLIDSPDDVHVAVLLLRTKEIRTNVRTGAVVPTAEILAVEAFTGATADAETLHRLLRRQHERRTGTTELPLELEQAIDALKVTDDDEDDEDASHVAGEPGDDQDGPGAQDEAPW